MKESSEIVKNSNNGVKRKVYQVQEVLHEVAPSSDLFNKEESVYLFYRDVIRYTFIPPRLIKNIYRIKRYRQGDNILEGAAPVAPFLNSNFDSSVIAHLLQQRFVYGIPVERIVKYYNEIGIDMPKATAHGLITKAGEIDRLDPVLKQALLDDKYLHFDETYHTVLDKHREKGSHKAYFWAALSNKNRQMHFFYDNGSRAKSVFENYLPKTYCGAIQTDGYSSYKCVEGWDYPNVKRLGCIQHCKRKFLDIEDQKQAAEIIKIFNEFYRIRNHSPEEEWISKSIEVYNKLEEKLRDIERNKENNCNSILLKAVAYTLNELDSIYNIISSIEYNLDNNNIYPNFSVIQTHYCNQLIMR